MLIVIYLIAGLLFDAQQEEADRYWSTEGSHRLHVERLTQYNCDTECDARNARNLLLHCRVGRQHSTELGNTYRHYR